MHGTCQARGVSGRVGNLSISHSCRACRNRNLTQTDSLTIAHAMAGTEHRCNNGKQACPVAACPMRLQLPPARVLAPAQQMSIIFRCKACAALTACGVRLLLFPAHVPAPAQQNNPPHGMRHCYSVRGKVAVAPRPQPTVRLRHSKVFRRTECAPAIACGVREVAVATGTSPLPWAQTR